MDTNAIRTRITTQGWKLLELPIKKNSPIPEERVVARWKLVATKGGKSIEVGGATIDEAMRNVGQLLGVVARQG